MKTFLWFAGAYIAFFLGAILLVLAASPFINWYNGFGFTWYF